MKIKLYITIALLLSTITVCFAFPKPKYESPDIVGQLTIPAALRGWRSKDVSEQLQMQKDDRYNFISDVYAREYTTRYGESLILLILDAGNFHHPKVCYGSSGFQIQELDDIEFSLKNKTFRAKTVLAKKSSGSTLIIYWMVINQNQVNWTEQKWQQLWFSLINKEKIGVMGRVDVPVKGDNVQLGIKLAQKFIRDISRSISPEDSAHIFGQ